MNNFKKLVKLYPLTPFYFGGEKTFGEDGTEYYVKSNYLPQQSAIIGLLRYQVLVHAGLIGKVHDKDQVKHLIGAESFRINCDYFQDFGSISNISPIFLYKGDAAYMPNSFDWIIDSIKNSQSNDTLQNYVQLEYKPSVNTKWLNGKKLQSCPTFYLSNKPYNYKIKNGEHWVSSDGLVRQKWDFSLNKTGGAEIDSSNGLFAKRVQAGNYRPLSRNLERQVSRGEKDNFYMQQLFQFESEDTCFAFFASLQDSVIPDGESIVSFGGERSLFRMVVADTETSFNELFSNAILQSRSNKSGDVLILTGDAYLKENERLWDFVEFAITNLGNFQNMRTTYHLNANYSKLNSGLEKNKEKFVMLKRGSIFYLKEGFDEDKLIRIFENTNLENIGYNHFRIIKK